MMRPRAALVAAVAVMAVSLLGAAHPAGLGDRGESSMVGHAALDPGFPVGGAEPGYDFQQGCTDSPGLDDCPPVDSLSHSQTAGPLQLLEPKVFHRPSMPGVPYVWDGGFLGLPSTPGEPNPLAFPPGAGVMPLGNEGTMTEYCNPVPIPPPPLLLPQEVVWTEGMPGYAGYANFLDAAESAWHLGEPNRFLVDMGTGQHRYHMEYDQVAWMTGGGVVPTVGTTILDDPDAPLGPPDGMMLRLPWDGYYLGKFDVVVEDLPVFDEPFWDDDRGTDIIVHVGAENPPNWCVYGSGPDDVGTGDGQFGKFYLVGTGFYGSGHNPVHEAYDAAGKLQDGNLTFDLSYFYTPARLERGIPPEKAGLLQYLLVMASPLKAPALTVDFEWVPGPGNAEQPLRTSPVTFIPHVDQHGHPLWCTPAGCNPADNEDDSLEAADEYALAWCFGTGDQMPNAGTWTVPGFLFWDGWCNDPLARTAKGYKANAAGWYDEPDLLRQDNFADGSAPNRAELHFGGIGEQIEHQFVAPGNYTVCLRAIHRSAWNSWVGIPKGGDYDNPQVHVRCKPVVVANLPPVADFTVAPSPLSPYTFWFHDLTVDPDWVRADVCDDVHLDAWASEPCAPYTGCGGSQVPGWLSSSWKDAELTCPPGGGQAPYDAVLGDGAFDDIVPDFTGHSPPYWNEPYRPSFGRHDDDGLVRWKWDFGDGTVVERTCMTHLHEPALGARDPDVDLLKDACPFRDEIDAHKVPWAKGAAPGTAPANMVPGACSSAGSAIPSPPATAPDCNDDFGADDLPDDEEDLRHLSHTFPAPGNYLVTLEVEDADGAVRHAYTRIFVESDDLPPLVRRQDDLWMPVGAQLTVDVPAVDPEGRTVGWTWENVPGWAVAQDDRLQGVPPAPGVHKEVRYTATDGVHEVSHTFTIRVFERQLDSDNDGLPDVADLCASRPESRGIDHAATAGDGCPGGTAVPAGTQPWLQGTPLAAPRPPSPSAPACLVTPGRGAAPALDAAAQEAGLGDLDGDGQADACDTDLDGDGVPQVSLGGAPPDNCPWVTNAGQAPGPAGQGQGAACALGGPQPRLGNAMPPAADAPNSRPAAPSGPGAPWLLAGLAVVLGGVAVTLQRLRNW